MEQAVVTANCNWEGGFILEMAGGSSSLLNHFTVLQVQLFRQMPTFQEDMKNDSAF